MKFLNLTAIFFLLLTVCTFPSDPFKNPDNAIIRKENTSRCIPDTIKPFSSYPCTVDLRLPLLIDTFYVSFQNDSLDTTIFSTTEIDSLLEFPLIIPFEDNGNLKVHIVKQNGSIDSLVKKIYVLSSKIYEIQIPDTIYGNSSYTFQIKYSCPDLVDSISVRLTTDFITDSLLIRSKTEKSDSLLFFSFSAARPGQYIFSTILHKKGGYVDSTLSETVANNFFPEIKALSPQISAYAGDSVTIEFEAVDPDGNLNRCFFYIDSIGAQGIIRNFEKTDDTTGKAEIKISTTGFDSISVFAYAEDSTKNASSFTSSIVFVKDTIDPVLEVISVSPVFGNDYTVPDLPCTIKVSVTDQSAIDSVLFNNQYMSLVKDTAMLITSLIDSGLNDYKIRAWDRASNNSSISVSINYTGGKVFAPRINSNLYSRTIDENQVFSTIYLDSCIDIEEDAPYNHDSCEWTISEEEENDKLVMSFDTTERIVTICVPDSEWNGSEIFIFSVSAPGGAVDQKPVIFTVNPINDPPVIVSGTYQCKPVGTSFDTILIDTCVTDPDNDIKTLTWSFDSSSGNILEFKKVMRGIVINPLFKQKNSSDNSTQTEIPNLIPFNTWTRKVVAQVKESTILPMAPFSDTLSATVNDGDNSVTRSFIFTWKNSCN